MSIRKKIAIWYVSSFGVLILAFSLALCILLKKMEEKSLELNLFKNAEEIEDLLENAPDSKWHSIIKDYPDYIIQLIGVKEKKAENIMCNKPPYKSCLKIPKSIISSLREREFCATDIIDSRDIKYKAVLVKLDGKSPSNLLLVASSTQRIDKTINNLRLLIIAVLPFILIVAFGGSNILIKLSLSPIREVIEAAKSVTVENLSQRIPEINTKDEIDELIKTFNQMIENLQDSVGRIKQFSSDVAHELKTPITVIKAKLEMLVKDGDCKMCKKELEALVKEMDKLTELVNSLLFLTRLESCTHNFQEEIELDVILLEIFEKYYGLAREKGVNMEIESLTPVKIRGSKVLLKQAISNLVDNAIKFTHTGGRITLSLKRHNSHSCVIVKDTGIGIPESEIKNIFSHFYRANSSRSKKIPGVGLGLTIVRKIAELHGARIEVESEPGRGSVFKLTFPSKEKQNKRDEH